VIIIDAMFWLFATLVSAAMTYVGLRFLFATRAELKEDGFNRLGVVIGVLMGLASTYESVRFEYHRLLQIAHLHLRR
jgi:hypothetical protein